MEKKIQMNRIIVQRMNAVIQSQNLSLEEAGEKLGIGLKKMKLWITGKKILKSTDVRNFAVAFNCKADYLFGMRDYL